MSEKPKDKRTKEYKQWQKENFTGVGDVVEYALNETPLKTVTQAVKKVLFKDGKDCGCDKRKQALNKLLPFSHKPARCLTEKEYQEYGEMKKSITLKTLSHEQKVYICKLFASVFNRGYYCPCSTCTIKPLFTMIDYLDKVYDSYDKH